jgi:hypothetical protein
MQSFYLTLIPDKILIADTDDLSIILDDQETHTSKIMSDDKCIFNITVGQKTYQLRTKTIQLDSDFQNMIVHRLTRIISLSNLKN